MDAVCRHGLWLVTLIIVVYTVALVAGPSRRLKPDRSSARGATIEGGSLPINWSWQDIRAADSETYRGIHGRPIAVGDYSSPVFDQHMSNWCGCCYLVAVVQMLQDRLHLILGLSNPTMKMFPCFQYNLQLALDTYNRYERRQRGDTWNACTGGMPTRVLNAIRSNHCLLRLSSDGIWMGHPIEISSTPTDGAKNPKLDSLESLEMAPESIMRRILKYGPVVLGINSLCLRDPTLSKRNGLVDAKIVATRDHAVTVIGWKKIGRKTCWIVRNSWGINFVPTERPDPSCVGNNYNRCVVDRTDWVGDPSNPGYAYIPIDYEGLRGYPSPWYDAIPSKLQELVPRSSDERHDPLGNPSAHGHHYTTIGMAGGRDRGE